MAYSLHNVQRLADIDAAEWDSLLSSQQPFPSHAFLSALECCDCLGREVGWLPQHFVLRDAEGVLIGAAPAYLKTNSFGEFVFDWSWATAHEQHGLRYYPKLVNAIPFTPVSGQRLLLAANIDRASASRALIDGMLKFAETQGLSSMHCLFPDDATLRLCDGEPRLLKRMGYQYHWHNIGYADFEHYLSSFRSRKRKKVRHERQTVRAAGVTTRVLHGDQIDEDLWDILFPLYQRTFFDKGNHPALTAAFFKHIGATLGRRLVVIVAERSGRIIAAAINLRDDSRLYGRYWGSCESLDNLHFEVCFYRGIDYCIEEGLDSFEPGAQGEHKITRGFLPTETWSLHWIADERFRLAIDDFLQREQQALKEYRAELDRMSPFRDSDSV